MAKVEGSNPFIRFNESLPEIRGFRAFWAIGCARHLHWVPRVGTKLLLVSVARRDAAGVRASHLQLEFVHHIRGARGEDEIAGNVDQAARIESVDRVARVDGIAGGPRELALKLGSRPRLVSPARSTISTTLCVSSAEEVQSLRFACMGRSVLSVPRPRGS